ncbi:MAG: hypothetical protein JWR50_2042 [Mucilaginibacter sp.]|nr:hypothetical protein [Mucilaginibacter sp.]
MKVPKLVNNLVLTGCFIINTVGAVAQQTFKYAAVLQKADSSAFYRIALLPSVLAKCNADLSDIRIIDSHNKFVPYIFGYQLPVKNQASFVTLPQIGRVTETDTTSIFVVENTGKFTINQLYLQFRNTAVQRTVDLSGTDDTKKWYAIKEDFNLTDAEAGNDGTFKQLLNFPASNYHYFKITINHKNREAIAILQAGIYKQQAVAPVYVPLPAPGFFQTDSAAGSHLHIRFNDSYAINKLHLSVSGTKYFKRAVSIYQLTGNRSELIYDGEINSAAAPDMTFSVKAKAIDLYITNGDNPPLKITGVNAYQLDQVLISYLEKGQQYQLLFNDAKAKAPDYDLKFFTDSLQSSIASLTYGKAVNNPLYHTKKLIAKRSMPVWTIWAAIIIALIVLGLLTLKMAREIEKK